MYVCSKLRLCSYLLSRGFHYISEREDRYNPKFKVWLFEMTPELRAAVNDYYNSDYFKAYNKEKENQND